MEHEVIMEFENINYVLLKTSGFTPWVAAWDYNKERGSWGQGHYFIERDDAIIYIANLLVNARENQ